MDFCLGVDDGVNGFIKQFGHFLHFSAVIGFRVEFRVNARDGFGLSSAKQSDIIKELFWIQIIRSHHAVYGNPEKLT